MTALRSPKSYGVFDDVTKVTFNWKISEIQKWPDSAHIFFYQDWRLTSKSEMEMSVTCGHVNKGFESLIIFWPKYASQICNTLAYFFNGIRYAENGIK